MTSQKAGRGNGKREEHMAQVNMLSLKNGEEIWHFAQEITRQPAFKGQEEPLHHAAMDLALTPKVSSYPGGTKKRSPCS